MDAQGAVDSLVGRLTSILIDEAQLLRGVRGDVVFIKDEMESMNSLLAHLTESQHHNQQVRTWMKHVVGLTRDCEGNVELYARYISGADPHSTSRGIHGRFRRVVQFVLTIRARHRVATRIRELKIRARDVGDRRMRYGVTVPPSAALGSGTMFVDVPNPREAANNREEVQRRAQLDGEPPDDDEKTIKKGTDQVIQWLFEEAPGKLLRVIPILCKDSSESKSALAQMAARMGKGVYEHSFAEKFSCKAMISVKDFNPGNGMGHFLRDLLQKLAPSWSWTKTPLDPMRPWDETSQLTKKLQGHLKGNRFLIVLEQVRDKKTWAAIKSALFHTETDCYPGSAIIMTTVDDEIAESSSPYKILKSPSLRGFMYVRASALILETPYCRMSNVRPILELCYPDAFAMKMVLHLLYANRDRTDYELKNICKVLSECKRLNKSIAKQMLMFCYTELPSKYRSCLLYLSIFSEDCTIRTTNLSRRWAIEGLITANRDHIGSATGGIRQQASPTDQADGYLDMLITRGFLIPGEISVAGNIKSCTMHHKVREFITKIATDVNFLDTDLPSDLAHHLSIHNRIGLQESHSNHHVKAGSHRIVAFLPYLAKSSQWKLLKLLDLEGCKGLTEKHMNSICKVLLLKYLSLRNTDVAELPKQINRLRCLETLDIRQTAVRAFATRSILLPMLKHLLAGQTDSLSNHSDRFVTLRLPSGIRKMEKLEILSHVEVSGNANDLIGVRQLLQLRKLGVILNCHKGMVLLFKQIKTLHACLRSLSIRINKLYKSEDTSCFPKEESKGTPDALLVALYSPPKLLQSLNISGIIGGLHLWIEGHKHLTKITLTETYLGEDALCIFGKLIILRCLRLRHNSYTGKELSFKKEEFKSLESLAIEGSNITNITFDTGSAPKLEMIVWSFASMEAISGVNHLTKLKKLELNGDSCIIGPVRVAIKEHPNHPGLKYNGQDQLQEAATKVAASTS